MTQIGSGGHQPQPKFLVRAASAQANSSPATPAASVMPAPITTAPTLDVPNARWSPDCTGGRAPLEEARRGCGVEPLATQASASHGTPRDAVGPGCAPQAASDHLEDPEADQHVENQQRPALQSSVDLSAGARVGQRASVVLGPVGAHHGSKHLRLPISAAMLERRS